MAFKHKTVLCSRITVLSLQGLKHNCKSLSITRNKNLLLSKRSKTVMLNTIKITAVKLPNEVKTLTYKQKTIKHQLKSWFTVIIVGDTVYLVLQKYLQLHYLHYF